MKKLIIISTAAILSYATSQICGCGSCKKANAQVLASKEIVKGEPKTVTLKVTGMTCAGCSKTIHSSLSKKDGILENEVKFPGDVAIVKYDPTKITEKEIIATIEKAGYKSEVIKEEIKGTEDKAGTTNKKCSTDCKKSCCSKK